MTKQKINKKRKQPVVVSVPFKGYIAAGSPIEAVEEHETITVPKSMVGPPRASIMLWA